MTTLAMVMSRHHRALEYDLMTMTGRTLGEYLTMGPDGAMALAAFIRYLPHGSALYREMHPRDEFWPWGTTMQTNAILADLYDAYVQAHTKKGRKAKPYPRPNAKKKNVGKGAIPVRDFMDWWNNG